MIKIKIITTALLMAGVTSCSNVREIGCVNGTRLTRVTARGVFSPSSMTILAHDPGHSGVEVLANASGPGFIPAVATAGGVAGGAALLRPARTSVSNTSNTDNRSSNVGNDVLATANVPVNIPPAVRPNTPLHPNVPRHPDSPGNGGVPGNGGANNPNN
jgi:hypothetical protein